MGRGDKHWTLAEKMLAVAERGGGYRAFFDGCCEPKNPGGTAGWGCVLFRGSERIWESSGFVPADPTTSNNIAEYLAVTAVLDWFAANDPKARGYVFGDSRLVVCQLWGWPKPGERLWKINGVDRPGPKGRYADYAVAARQKLKALPGIKGGWIPRQKNEIADDLSKSHLRRLGVKFAIQPEDGEDPEKNPRLKAVLEQLGES